MTQRTHQTNYIRTIGVVVIIFTLVGWFVYTHWVNPYPIHGRADPELPYFMSSLSKFQGAPYTFVDHPGTPVEMIGTGLFALTYPLIGSTSSFSFIEYHIHHPKLFLTLARGLLTLGSIATVILMARCAKVGQHWTDDLIAVSAAALFFAIHPLAFTAVTTWSHNSFNFPAGTLLLLGLLLILQSEQPLQRRNLLLLGICAGILSAVQLTFVTWIFGIGSSIGVYLYIKKYPWQKAMSAFLFGGLATVTGFVISTLPIIPYYPKFGSIIVHFLIHQGPLGTGPAGIISQQSALSNLVSLWKQMQGLFVAMIVVELLVLVTFILHRRKLKANASLWSIVIGLTGHMILMLALIIKHPGITYAQSLGSIIPVLLIAILTLLSKIYGQANKPLRLLKFGIGLMVFAGLFINLYRTVIITRVSTAQIEKASAGIDSFIEDYKGLNDHQLIKLWTYGMPSNCYALWYGNRYANQIFAEEIADICAQDLELDIWLNQVQLPNGTKVPLEGINWDIIMATETTLLDNPNLAEYGRVVTSDQRLGSFGRVIYIIPSHPIKR